MSDFLPVREIAQKLNCCDETVRRMIRSGKLPAVQLGQQYRVSEAALMLSRGTSHNNPQQPTTRGK